MIKNVLIALDSFKGSISSSDANTMIEKGIKSINPQLNIEKVSIGDGGEGTLDSLVYALKGKFKTIKSINSKNQNIDTKLGILGDKIIIESSDVIGLNRIDTNPDAYNDTSKGLGLVIKQALDLNPSEIILALGGSAINDLGLGMLESLGVEFFDENGEKISPSGTNDLHKIFDINFKNLDSRIKQKKFTILSDVQNTLCGEKGATFTYGRQKGIMEDDFIEIDNHINRIAKIIDSYFGKSNIDEKMTGSAGGLGFIFMTVFNSKFYNGIEKILEMINMEEKISCVDLVITGEGSIDFQTYFGKAPVGISNLSKKKGKLCFAVTGRNGMIENYDNLFDYIFSLSNYPMSLEESLVNVGYLLEMQGKQICRIINLINKNIY